LNNSPGFTLLELLVVITLIALASTIVLMNTDILDDFETNEISSYESFITFLGEESALKKKKLAWFVGNNSQSVMYLKEGSWVDLELQKNYFQRSILALHLRIQRAKFFLLLRTDLYLL
jgi:prepilin-type N-terminal cleavage/methylation domain-containing protein